MQIPLGEEGAPCESASRAGREIRRASDASVMVTREVLPGNGGTGVACVVARSNDVSREIFLVLSGLVDSDKFATLVLSLCWPLVEKRETATQLESISKPEMARSNAKKRIAR